MRFWTRKSRKVKREIDRKRWIFTQNRSKWAKKLCFGENMIGRESIAKTDFTSVFATL